MRLPVIPLLSEATCRVCGQPVSEVDHVVDSFGPPWNSTDIVALWCPDCEEDTAAVDDRDPY